MAKKKAETSSQAVVDEGITVAPKEEEKPENGTHEKYAPVKKSQAIRQLLEEWTNTGRAGELEGRGSPEKIIAELQGKYPGIKFTPGDVAATKGKWFKSKAVPGAAPAPTRRTETPPAEPTLSQLISLNKQLAEKKLSVIDLQKQLTDLDDLARSVGGWSHLKTCLDALAQFAS